MYRPVAVLRVAIYSIDQWLFYVWLYIAQWLFYVWLYIAQWLFFTCEWFNGVVGVQVFGPMERDDVNARGLSRHHIMQAVEQSLHRLHSEYIDLYQVSTAAGSTRAVSFSHSTPVSVRYIYISYGNYHTNKEEEIAIHTSLFCVIISVTFLFFLLKKLIYCMIVSASCI